MIKIIGCTRSNSSPIDVEGVYSPVDKGPTEDDLITYLFQMIGSTQKGMSPLSLGPLIATGSTADVHLASYGTTGRVYVVKTAKPGFEMDIEREAKVLETIKGIGEETGVPLMVEYIPEHHQLVMNYIEGPTLDQVVSSYCRPVPEAFAVNIIYQLLQILASLHSVNIVHGDIKPNNVVVNNGCVTLIDFGTSICRDIEEIQELYGCPAFLPPEALYEIDEGKRRRKERRKIKVNKEEKEEEGEDNDDDNNDNDDGREEKNGSIKTAISHYPTPSGDIWACGILLFFLLSARVPCSPLEALEGAYRTKRNIKSLISQMIIPRPSRGVGKLLGKMLNPNPKQRPSAEKLLLLGVFQGIRDTNGAPAAVQNSLGGMKRRGNRV